MMTMTGKAERQQTFEFQSMRFDWSYILWHTAYEIDTFEIEVNASSDPVDMTMMIDCYHCH
jgi:hypothetical protein